MINLGWRNNDNHWELSQQRVQSNQQYQKMMKKGNNICLFRFIAYKINLFNRLSDFHNSHTLPSFVFFYFVCSWMSVQELCVPEHIEKERNKTDIHNRLIKYVVRKIRCYTKKKKNEKQFKFYVDLQKWSHIIIYIWNLWTRETPQQRAENTKTKRRDEKCAAKGKKERKKTKKKSIIIIRIMWEFLLHLFFLERFVCCTQRSKNVIANGDIIYTMWQCVVNENPI